MGAAYLGNAGFALGTLEDSPGTPLLQVLLRVPAGEQPERRPGDCPVAAELLQQTSRQQRIAILVAFATAHVQHAPLAIDVRDLQPYHLADAQAAAVRGHQQ